MPTLHIIHLPERTDRMVLLKKELETQGINDCRLWPGIKNDVNPCQGISAAHKQIVQYAKDNNLDEITIAEDDIQFTAPGAWQYYLTNMPGTFDLYLGSVYVLHEIKGHHIENFTGLTLYTIRKRFYDEFLGTPNAGNIDVNLYGRGWYALCYPFAAIQHETYSDNSQGLINYSQYMQGKLLFGHEPPIQLPVNLFVSYYNDEHEQRRSELEKCFRSNISNPLIDKVYVFCSEPDVELVLNFPNLDKIIIIKHDGKPTYQEMFDEINTRTREHEVNIIANSDIYFDTSINLMHKIKPNECYALTRWEFGVAHQIQDRGDSQDVWVFRGKIKDINYSEFCMGVPGCDNRIAHELQSAGYTVTNPSLTIKTWHLHESNIRRYDYHKEHIPQPYLKIKSTELL
jgi:hypothetical protein